MRVYKAEKQYEEQIKELKKENKRLQQEVEALKRKVQLAERKCACFRNNQKLPEEKAWHSRAAVLL